jgi:hypothetical protein
MITDWATGGRGDSRSFRLLVVKELFSIIDGQFESLKKINTYLYVNQVHYNKSII